MNIPKQVELEAKKLGNSINYLGEYKGELVFAVGYLDKNGKPLPTGMPIFIFFDGENARAVVSDSNFKVLREIIDSLPYDISGPDFEYIREIISSLPEDRLPNRPHKWF